MFECTHTHIETYIWGEYHVKGWKDVSTGHGALRIVSSPEDKRQPGTGSERANPVHTMTSNF